MRMTLAMATVALSLLLVTWLSFSALNTNAERFDRALSTLDRLAATESELRRDVLSARAGLLRNYDPVVHEVDALDEELERLRAVAAIDAATAAAIDRVATSVARQEELVELFKSDNALLQNSLAYFDRSSARLGASNPSDPIAPAVSALAAGMLHLTLDTSTATAAKVQGLLDEVAGNSSSIRRPRFRESPVGARASASRPASGDRSRTEIPARPAGGSGSTSRPLLGLEAPEAVANDGATIPSPPLRGFPAVDRGACSSRATAQVASSGVAAPRGVRACDCRRLDALHKRAAARSGRRDRAGARRDGGMRRRGPRLFPARAPSATVSFLAQDGSCSSTRLAGGSPRASRAVRSDAGWNRLRSTRERPCRRGKPGTRVSPLVCKAGPAP